MALPIFLLKKLTVDCTVRHIQIFSFVPFNNIASWHKSIFDEINELERKPESTKFPMDMP